MILLRRRAGLATGAAAMGAAATLLFGGGGRKLVPSAWAMGRLEGLSSPGASAPAITFYEADGTARTLADFAGTGLVLNFWATWCVPCVEEMPSLAGLSSALGGAKVRVLPLSSDGGGKAAVERFFAQQKIAGLPVLLDPHGSAARAFGARGLPTTVLIDASGRERGRLEGAANWSDPAAVAAVRALAPA